MKTKVMLRILSFAFLFTSVTAHTNAEPPVANWEKLGQKKVNYKLDRDEILVTAYEGTFTALRIHVEKGGINLHRVAIHYRNGQVQDFNVDKSMPAGSISPAIDLKGNRRIIKKVVFWYDTKNFSDQKARVELWGKK